jgi:DNA modification methylase
MNSILTKISDIKLNPNNPRLIKDDKFKKLVQSIKDFPEMLNIRPIVVNNDMVILGGNMRFKACKEAGLKEIPVIIASDLTEEQQREFLIKDNVSGGEWDFDMLANEWDVNDLEEWGLDIPNFETETDEILEETEKSKKLSDRFIIPPFSVLDTKQGAWQQRKNYWLSLGIKSEIGRKEADYKKTDGISKRVEGGGFSINADEYNGGNVEAGRGNSIFDPVLCELAYQWFNIPKGNILDPFAGGSVRGIVAAKLGFQYLGNDLRNEQINANRLNATEVLKESELYPTWTCGDSLNIDTIAKDYKADMIFSCPPYADLEVYSDAKEDISNMPYKEFLSIYKEIIRKSCEMLKEDRFAVFVVGDVRDKKGFYQNFVSDTIQSFIESNVLFYNEMILVNSIGSLALRAGRQFSAGRKVGKQHQNVLVFYKGNPKNIKANYPELDLSYIQDEQIK